MAGRFLFQKLASRISRSTSLLGAHASSPVTRRASEGGIRTLCNIFNRASTQPSTPLPGIQVHGSPGRYLSTFRCTRVASFRSNPPNGLPPIITGCMEPALADYVRAKQTFSSKCSSANGTKLSAREAEWKARREAAIAASKAECEAWDAQWKAEDAAFDRFVTIILGSWCLIGLVFNSMLDSASSRDGKGKSGSHCHSGAVQNPEIPRKSGIPVSMNRVSSKDGE